MGRRVGTRPVGNKTQVLVEDREGGSLKPIGKFKSKRVAAKIAGFRRSWKNG